MADDSKNDLESSYEDLCSGEKKRKENEETLEDCVELKIAGVEFAKALWNVRYEMVKAMVQLCLVGGIDPNEAYAAARELEFDARRAMHNQFEV